MAKNASEPLLTCAASLSSLGMPMSLPTGMAAILRRSTQMNAKATNPATMPGRAIWAGYFDHPWNVSVDVRREGVFYGDGEGRRST